MRMCEKCSGTGYGIFGKEEKGVCDKCGGKGWWKSEGT